MKPLSVIVQMKAIGHFISVVLLIMLYGVVLTFEYLDETLKCDRSNETVLSTFDSCGAVYPTFEFVDELLKCDHSNESY